MKILFVTDTYKPAANGPVYSIESLAAHISNFGHDVFIASPGKGKRLKATVDPVGDGRIKVFRVPSVPLPIYPDLWAPVPVLAGRDLSKLISRINPDIIHVHDHLVLGSAAIAIAKKSNIPIVGTNHFMPENFLRLLPFPEPIHNEAVKLAWKQFVGKYSQLDHVTTPSQIAADVIRKIGFKNEVTVVSNGVDLKRFNSSNNGNILRRKYKLPKKNVILFVGRLDPEKRLDLLLHAFAKVIQGVDAHLVLVGRGKQAIILKKLVQELNLDKKVTFTGFVNDSDLPYMYKAADLFVMPSDAELQSISTMEAMASGLPIVAANAVALPLLVKNNVNGFLFKPGDANDLAAKLIKVLSRETNIIEMGAESLKIIKKHDSLQSSLKILGIYKKVLGAKSKEKALLYSEQKKRAKRRVVMSETFDASADRFWQIASDVSNYPRYFKYVHIVKKPGDFEIGRSWWDISTIVYVPMRVKHKIVQVVPNRGVRQEIDLPFGGKITQNIRIAAFGDMTRVKIDVLVNQKSFMDFLFGKIIEMRTRSILVGAHERIQKEIAAGVFEEADVESKSLLGKMVIPNTRHIAVPVFMSVVILTVLALVAAFNMPTEIKAAPGKVISRVESLEVAEKSVKTFKTGIIQVQKTVHKISK